MTQEATSAPDSGLPPEIEAALAAYLRAHALTVTLHRDIEGLEHSKREAAAARAELTAKLLKWRDEEVTMALKANAESISAALWGSR